jgi:hypothetical protein
MFGKEGGGRTVFLLVEGRRDRFGEGNGARFRVLDHLFDLVFVS